MASNPRQIKYTLASQVRTESIDWLVDCWIPRGSVTLLAGREGIGKSTVAVDWAAQATTGKLTGSPMNVGYVVTEDSREHTVVPRLKAAGADLRRVMFIDASIQDPDDPDVRYDAVLDLPQDFHILRQFIDDVQVGLVVLDAAKSVMSPKLDGNNDLSIRQFLEPMHRVAHETGCTFIGLSHFGKKETADTGKLIIGSSAWSQVARSVVSVAEDKDNGTIKVWNSKANLAPRIRTMEAQVVTAIVRTDDGKDAEVGRIEWIGESDEDGSALLSASSSDMEDDADEVKMIVLDYLAQNGGSAPARDVLRAANAAGLSSQTVKNKRRSIGVSTRKQGKEWVWTVEGTGATNTSPTVGTFSTLVSSQVEGGKKVPEEGEDTEGTKVPREGTPRDLPSDPPHLAAVPDLADDTDRTIWDTLGNGWPMSARAITSAVPGATEEDVQTRLQTLVDRGLVDINERGKYQRKEVAA